MRLHLNEFPTGYPLSPRVNEAVDRYNFRDDLNCYPEGQPPELIKELAAHLGVKEENLLITCGSSEALYLAFRAFFIGKKDVLMSDVTWGQYKFMGTELGINFKEVPLRDDFTMNPDDYQGGGGALIANPNANTGLALSKSNIEKIIKNNPNSIVIIDEAYADYSNEESVVPLIKKYPNLIVMQTFSKGYPLASRRVGYAIGNAELISKFIATKNAINERSTSTFACGLALACLRDNAHYKKLRDEIIETREWVTKQLNGIPSQGNFVSVKFESEKKALEVQAYLKSHGILVRHVPEQPRITSFLRFGIGTRQEMERVVELLKSM